MPFVALWGMGPDGPGLQGNHVAKLDWQVFKGQHIDRYAQQLLQFVLQAAQIEQRGARQGVYLQVQVAAIAIIPAQCRAKFTGVRHAITRRGKADGITVLEQGLGRAHEIESTEANH